METTVPATSVTLDDYNHRQHGQHHFPWLGQTDQQRIADLSDKVGNLHRDTVGVIEKTATAEALAGCKIGDEICASTSEIKNAVALGGDASTVRDCLTQTQVGQLGTSVVAYAKDAQATAYQIEGRAGLALAERANAIGVQADKNFYALSVEAVKNASAISVEAVKNASAAELTAERNFNALSVQAEKIAAAQALAAQECCCKLEAVIVAQANQTRDLANDIDRRRGDRELVIANNEITYLKGRIPAGTPV